MTSSVRVNDVIPSFSMRDGRKVRERLAHASKHGRPADTHGGGAARSSHRNLPASRTVLSGGSGRPHSYRPAPGGSQPAARRARLTCGAVRSELIDSHAGREERTPARAGAGAAGHVR